MFQPLELPDLSPLGEIIRQVREELLREAGEGHPQELTDLLTGLETEIGAQQVAMEAVVPGELAQFKIDHDQVAAEFNSALSRHSERIRKAIQDSGTEVVPTGGDLAGEGQRPAAQESTETRKFDFSSGAELVVELVNLTPQVFPAKSKEALPRFMRTSGNIWENWNMREAARSGGLE
ncbi:MAG: hypothetical protein ACKOS8_13285 [Gemmataceae bacterium]